MSQWLPSWFPGRGGDPEKEGVPHAAEPGDVVTIDDQPGKWSVLKRVPSADFVEVIDMLQLWHRDRGAVKIFDALLIGKPLVSWQISVRTLRAPSDPSAEGQYEVLVSEVPLSTSQRERWFVSEYGGLRYTVNTTAITGFLCALDIAKDDFIVTSTSHSALSFLEVLGGIESFQATPARPLDTTFVAVEQVLVTPREEESTSPRRTSPTRRTRPVVSSRLCSVSSCEAAATGLCGDCLDAAYCSKACQRSDWDGGSHTCGVKNA